MVACIKMPQLGIALLAYGHFYTNDFLNENAGNAEPYPAKTIALCKGITGCRYGLKHLAVIGFHKQSGTWLQMIEPLCTASYA
jgi:hypothetical protein